MTIRLTPVKTATGLSPKRPPIAAFARWFFYSPRAADGDFGATQKVMGFVSRAGYGLFAVVGCQ